MRQPTTAEVRLDQGKAASFGATRPGLSPFWLPTGRLRSNFVEAHLDQADSHPQQLRYPENVGQDRCEGSQPRPCQLPNGRGRGVAADVPGNPPADARCEHHPRRHEGRWGQMRQTAAEVRLDATTAERFTASAQSSDRFHQLPRTLARHLPLPETPEGAILTTQLSGIGGMSVRIGVIPAKAGVQGERSCPGTLDSRLRGNDKWTG